ncbi:MAG: Gfo/Idh/MocA family oxidoreductase [Hungatella sp.]
MKRVGLVGCGGIAKVHAEVLKNMENIQLAAFADCIPERAEAFAQQYGAEGAKAYASLQEMLKETDLDAVHICTPHDLHVPMAVELLKHSIHVLMEKPPAISRAQFLELTEAAERSSGVLGFCFQNRYNKTTKELDRLVQEGDLGEIKGARAFVTWNRSQEYYTRSNWRGREETEGGGALINQSVHTLDLLVHYLGRPEWSEASMHNHHLKQTIEVEDTVEAYIRFATGTACFYATTAYAADAAVLMEFQYERARVRMEGNEITCHYPDGRCVRTVYDGTVGVGKSYWGDGHGACIRDYYACLEQGSKVLNRLESVADTFGLMMDLYQSAKEHRVIPFEKENR